MLRIGCFLLLLGLSLSVKAQPKNGEDSIAPLKKWLAELISAGEQDSARVFKTLNEASAQARAKNRVRDEAIIQRAGGEYFRKLKQYHRSFGWYYRSYDLFVQTNDPYELVNGGLELARAQYYRGNYRQSMQHYSFAVQTA